MTDTPNPSLRMHPSDAKPIWTDHFPAGHGADLAIKATMTNAKAAEVALPDDFIVTVKRANVYMLTVQIWCSAEV